MMEYSMAQGQVCAVSNNQQAGVPALTLDVGQAKLSDNA